MKLTIASIKSQLAHELLTWKELNLHPSWIVGTLNPQQAFARYQGLLRDTPLINTGTVLEELNLNIQNAANTGNAFVRHFDLSDPKPDLNPHFCLTALLRDEMLSATGVAASYDEKAQSDWIERAKANQAVFPLANNLQNGLHIAITTLNVEMVAFLLHPALKAVTTAAACQRLLDIPEIASHTPIRQVIFEAYALQWDNALTVDTLKTLIVQVETIDEWIALYKPLNAEQRQQLFNLCSADRWLKLIKDERCLIAVECISDQNMTSLVRQLLSKKASIVDGHLIIRLMGRMNQTERLEFIADLGSRVNDLFSNGPHQASLRDCLSVMGYEVPAASTKITLKNIHGLHQHPSLMTLISDLNQTIWTSGLDNQTKLQYFYVVRQLITALPENRLAAIRAYETCVQRGERKLIQKDNEKLFFLVRWVRAFLRLLGLKKPFPVTMQARDLLRSMRQVVSVSPNLYASILDLSDILELGDPRIANAATQAFTQAEYVSFWLNMSLEKQVALLSNRRNFEQLLTLLPSEEAIPALMKGVSDDMRDALVNLEQDPTPLLQLLQMSSLLSIRVLMDTLGADRQKGLLINDTKLKILLSNLPMPYFTSFLDSFTEEDYESLRNQSVRNQLTRLQAVLVASTVEQYPLIQHYFKWNIPLINTPQELGQLMNQLPIEKLSVFCELFLKARVFTLEELATLLPEIKAVEKRCWMIKSWMAITPVSTWSSDLLVLFPDMESEAQANLLRRMSDDDLYRIIETKQVEPIVKALLPDNRSIIFDRYRELVLTKPRWTALMQQLSANSLDQVLNKSPYSCLTSAGCKGLIPLIRELKILTDAQWGLIVPKLHEMGRDLFGASDALVQLLTQHVPESERVHVLNLIRNIGDEALPLLEQLLFKDPLVQVLMTHQKIEFKSLTVEHVGAYQAYCLAKTDNPNTPVPAWVNGLNQSLDALIQSHREKLDKELHTLETLFNKGNTLLTLSSNVFSYRIKNEQECLVIHTWQGDVSLQLTDIRKTHQELVTFYSFSRHAKGMAALKHVNDYMLGLIKIEEAFIATQMELIKNSSDQLLVEKTKLLLQRLTAFENALQTIISVDEAELLAAIPDSCIPAILNQAEEFKFLLDLTLTPENAALFLHRARTFLIAATDQPVWTVRLKTLSPSSLKLLLNGAPKELFSGLDCKDFRSLLVGFRNLSDEQWQAILPDLLTIGEKQFSERDEIVQSLRKHVPERAHSHVLSLIRSLEGETSLRAMLSYLTSPIVRYLRGIQKIDELKMTHDNLPKLEADANQVFSGLVQNAEKALEEAIRALSMSLMDETEGLLKPLTDMKDQRGRLNFFSSDTRIATIEPRVEKVLEALDQIKKKYDEVKCLYAIQKTEENLRVILDFTAKLEPILTGVTAFEQRDEFKNIPRCTYGEPKKTNTGYVKVIHDALTELSQALRVLQPSLPVTVIEEPVMQTMEM